MSDNADQELLNDQQSAIVLTELSLEGYLDWKSDELVRLSEKG